MGEQSKLIDMTGQVFGQLTVLRRGECSGAAVAWVVQCTCGKTSTVTRGNLRTGHTKSCGCLRGERHKCSGTPMYRVYWAMLKRCHNERDGSYKRYGGRGIRVCKRWRKSFAAFREDMGERPDDHSIDRIDNNGNYTPKNCRWATVEEQAHNKRNNRWITANGQTKILADWARTLGCRGRVISNRLSFGWSEEEAVLTPVGPTGVKRKG